MIARALSVRETEALVKKLAAPAPPATGARLLPQPTYTPARRRTGCASLWARRSASCGAASGRNESKSSFGSESELNRLYEQLLETSHHAAAARPLGAGSSRIEVNCKRCRAIFRGINRRLCLSGTSGWRAGGPSPSWLCRLDAAQQTRQHDLQSRSYLDCRFPLEPDPGSAAVRFETPVALEVAPHEPSPSTDDTMSTGASAARYARALLDAIIKEAIPSRSNRSSRRLSSSWLAPPILRRLREPGRACRRQARHRRAAARATENIGACSRSCCRPR